MKRTVTEQDFRMPEFRDAKVEDYEFRGDGKLVRKDRWETAVRSICCTMGFSVREFEIPDVVAAVERMAEDNNGWNSIVNDGPPERNCIVDVRLVDGSRLRKVIYKAEDEQFVWQHGSHVVVLDFVLSWKERDDDATSR